MPGIKPRNPVCHIGGFKDEGYVSGDQTCLQTQNNESVDSVQPGAIAGEGVVPRQNVEHDEIGFGPRIRGNRNPYSP